MVTIIFICLLFPLYRFQTLQLPLQSYITHNISPIRDIDDIFARLPSLKQLDEIIIARDAVAILKIIQVIASNSEIKCQFKVSYLLELQGRIKSEIYQEKVGLQQLKSFTQILLDQIERIQIQTLKLSTEKRLLFLDQTQLSITLTTNDITLLYDNFNSLQVQIPKLELEIAEQSQKIKRISSKIDGDREQIASTNRQIGELQASILNVGESDLLLVQKQKLQTYRNQLNIALQINENILYQSQRSLIKQQQVLQQRYLQLDNIKKQYQQLQVALQRLRQQYFKLKQQHDQLKLQINQNNQQIDQLKQQINNYEITQLQAAIKVFEDRLPGLYLEIDRQYYTCYTGNNTVEKVDRNEVMYLIDGTIFALYLENNYEYNVSSFPSQLMLEPLDIFSDVWHELFGNPFELEEVINRSQEEGVTFTSDFYCLNPSQTISGFGVIEGIRERRILIMNQDQLGVQQSLVLIIGACSRFQCSECGQQLRLVGMVIYWRGLRHPKEPTYIQLYSGTVI